MDESDEDPEDRPLDREELRRRAAKQLARREIGDGATGTVADARSGAKKAGAGGKGAVKRR